MEKKVRFVLLLILLADVGMVAILVIVNLMGGRISLSKSVAALMGTTGFVAVAAGGALTLSDYDPPLPAFLQPKAPPVPPVDPALAILTSDGTDPAMAILQLRRLRGDVVSPEEEQHILEALRLKAQLGTAQPIGDTDLPLEPEPDPIPEPVPAPVAAASFDCDPWAAEPVMNIQVPQPVSSNDLFDVDMPL